MRQILIDRARKRLAAKRGGGSPQLSLEQAVNLAEAQSSDLLLIEGAPTRLETLDSRQAQVVEMRFFGGMSDDDIAEAPGVSTRAVNREWRMARGSLYKEIRG